MAHSKSSQPRESNMRDRLQLWFRYFGWTPSKRSCPSARLTVERLDDRCLLNGGTLSGSLSSLATNLPTGSIGHFGPLAMSSAQLQSGSIIPNLATAANVTSTAVAPNGDQNPYGVAFVPADFQSNGKLHAGDLLVADFNNSTKVGNTQGTGTSIVRITPGGHRSMFFQDSSAVGLDTALGVLKKGFVLVGNVPNVGGIALQGALRIIDGNGKVVETLTDPVKLDGPWDLTVYDQGDHALVFVSNVLNGTVTRINLTIPDQGAPIVTGMTTIASGYGFRTDPAAFVVGPTGLAYDPVHDVLYVASTADNAVFAVAQAAMASTSNGTGTMVIPPSDPHLHGPLGLVLAPNGDLILANGDAVGPPSSEINELVEYTPSGQFVAEMPVDTTPTPGGAFGIALISTEGGVRFAAVDDNFNTVTIWTL
jgi:hypothetical protein